MQVGELYDILKVSFKLMAQELLRNYFIQHLHLETPISYS